MNSVLQNSVYKPFSSRPHTGLQDSELLAHTLAASKNEKAATLALLDYLLEIDLRKLFCAKACSSLFDYCVRELGLSEPAASERVSTVRLMQSVPQVKEHLEKGDLSLTTAAQVQRFIKTEEKASPRGTPTPFKSAEQKNAIIEACLGQSKREVEKVLLTKQSESAKCLTQEKVKLVTPSRSEIKFTADESTVNKLKQIQELIGNQSLETIFDEALNLMLAHAQKKYGRSAIKTQPAGKSKSTHSSVKPKISPDPCARFISVDMKKLIFARSRGQCEFIEKASGKRCPSCYRLQFDHKIPFALGGKTELENLRHFCFNHNQYSAKKWGLEKKMAYS